jgi:predicted nucleic acid-binding Zn ribbon protein
MAVTLRKDGKWEVYAYDPAIGKKRYIGRYKTETEARKHEANSKAFAKGQPTDPNLKRCPGCRKWFEPMDEWHSRCSERCDAMIKRRHRRKRERQTDDHWVYTCINEHGEPIYVGFTSTGLRRHREHGREMFWWRHVTTITVEHYATREEGLAAEAEAIAALRPRYNTLHVVEEIMEEVRNHAA